jgi:hypothetical protein
MAEAITAAENPLWKQASMGRPFMTYHPSPVSLPGQAKATAANYFGDQDWLSLDAVQSGHTDHMADNIKDIDPPLHKWEATKVWEPLKEMWDTHPSRPIIDLESHCEYSVLGSLIDSRQGMAYYKRRSDLG